MIECKRKIEDEQLDKRFWMSDAPIRRTFFVSRSEYTFLEKKWSPCEEFEGLILHIFLRKVSFSGCQSEKCASSGNDALADHPTRP